jgi:hypothetical protein
LTPLSVPLSCRHSWLGALLIDRENPRSGGSWNLKAGISESARRINGNDASGDDEPGRWRHIHGCGRLLNSVRHTVTDRLLATYKIGEPRPANTGSSAT